MGKYPTKSTFTTGDGPSGAALNDLDSDGDLDLATVNGLSDDVYIFENNGTGTFALELIVGVDDASRDIALGDFDGDSVADLTTANAGSGDTVSVSLNETELIFIPFASFEITKAKIKFKNDPNKDKFEIRGDFVLGETSDGIDPANEEVELSVGLVNILVAAGDFEEKNGDFEFEGELDGAEVEFKIELDSTNEYSFKLKVDGFDLTGTSNLLDVGLIIGDDFGDTTIRLKGELGLELDEDDDDDDD